MRKLPANTLTKRFGGELAINTPTRHIRSGRCAAVTRGHTTPTEKSATNSRRFIIVRPPHLLVTQHGRHLEHGTRRIRVDLNVSERPSRNTGGGHAAPALSNAMKCNTHIGPSSIT